MRAEQTVSEMVVESLARRAEALSEGTDRTFEEAFVEVLETPAGRRLTALADRSHRHEKAAQWQAGLLADREAQRPARLRSSSENGHEEAVVGSLYLGRARYMERVEDTDGREEYHAFLRERFIESEPRNPLR